MDTKQREIILRNYIFKTEKLLEKYNQDKTLSNELKVLCEEGINDTGCNVNSDCDKIGSFGICKFDKTSSKESMCPYFVSDWIKKLKETYKEEFGKEYQKIDYDKIDDLCIPFIKFFNKIGLETISSCEGHNNTNLFRFYIDFSYDVEDSDIHNFMKNFNKGLYGNYNNKQIRGHFIKVCYGYNAKTGNIMENWRYVVDFSTSFKTNQKLAYNDLEIFKDILYSEDKE